MFRMTTLQAAATALGLVFALSGCGEKQPGPPPAQAKSLRVAVKALADGVSEAVLPPELARLSVDGKIYITKTDAVEVALWRTQLGKAGHFHGVAYWQGTLPALDKLELNAPSAKGLIKWKITTWRKAYADHWAYLSTDFAD